MLFLDNKTFKKEIITLILDVICFIILFICYFFIAAIGLLDNKEFYFEDIKYYMLIATYPFFRQYFILLIRKLFNLTNNIQEAFKQKNIIFFKLFICNFLILLPIACFFEHGFDYVVFRFLGFDFLCIILWFLVAFILNFIRNKKIIKTTFLSSIINFFFILITIILINIYEANSQTTIKFLFFTFLIFFLQKILCISIQKFYNCRLWNINIDDIKEPLINGFICFFICRICTILLGEIYEVECLYTISFIICLFATLIFSYIMHRKSIE